MRTSQDQLKKDLCTFMVLADYCNPDMGDPVCPLCNDPGADYRGLSDEELAQAWKAAAEDHNRLFQGDCDPQEPCWKGIFCCENWREAREENGFPRAP